MRSFSIFCRTCRIGGALLFLFFSANWAFAQIKIMPLGDSITSGVENNSPDPPNDNGYRDDLATLLTAEGVNFDFVGSLEGGVGFDNEHEGHNGFRADQIDGSINTYLNSNPPNIVLLHIGTNDISNDENANGIINEISSILDKIKNKSSNIKIIIASIVPRTDAKDEATTTLNALIEDLFRTKREAGFKIWYAGINEVFKTNPNWATDYFTDPDQLHPNDTGYGIMAQVWRDVVMTAINTTDVTVSDNFERTTLGITWDSDAENLIQNGDLVNTATTGDSRWEYMSTYRGQKNPSQVSIKWSSTADAAGINDGGLALMLNSPSKNASGYLAWITTGDNNIRLWTIASGKTGVDLNLEKVSSAPVPVPGDVFRVDVTVTGNNIQFSYYVNGTLGGSITTSNPGLASDLYSGVILRHNRNNDIEDFSVLKFNDTNPPGTINNLSAGVPTATSVPLTWTATGDDGTTGQASSYDLRYSTSAINANNFSSATQVTGLPTPAPSGTPESVTVGGLSAGTTYFFAVKAKDEAGNSSPISNVVNATTVSGNLAADNFDRTDLGPNWTTDAGYQIVNGQLHNGSSSENWDELAIYSARKNPIEITFTWAADAAASGIDQAGFAIVFGSPSPNASGYAITRRNPNQQLRLWNVVNGTVTTPIHIFGDQGGEVLNLSPPQAGDVMRLVISEDPDGNHFDFYKNDAFDARVTDAAKTFNLSDDHWAGVALRANNPGGVNINNDIDDFKLLLEIGAPSQLVIASGNNQTGTVGQVLPEPLKVLVADDSGNPVQGVNVNFVVTAGGGSVDVPPPSEHIIIETEVGTLTAPMTVGTDGAASGGKFIFAPDGTDPTSSGRATFSFSVEVAGTYYLWGRCIAPDANNDAFNIKIDNGTEYLWDVGQRPPGGLDDWTWDQVSHRGTGTATNPQINPVIETLSAGIHTLTIRVGKDGTKIDQFLMTRNANFVPTNIVQPGGTYTDATGFAEAHLTLGAVTGTNTVLASSSGLPSVQFTAEATPAVPANIALDSGNNQTGTVSKPLTLPFKVKVTTNTGGPAPGTNVTFNVTSGGGNFDGASEVTVVTDIQGIASATLTLGPTLGGINTAQASASNQGTPLTGSPVTFSATAALPQTLEAVSALTHSGTVNIPLADSIKVRVKDALGQPLPGFTVTFSVTLGGGKVNGSSNPVNVISDANGIARVQWSLGPTIGTNNNKIRASATFNNQPLSGSPIDFTASAQVGTAATLTKISGDNQTGLIQTTLAQPFVVKVTDAGGNPVNGWPVTFSVTAGGGNFNGNSSETKNTNASGEASATLTLGSTAGLNNNKAQATAENNSVALSGSPVSFQASATASSARNLAIQGGANQTGPVGELLSNQIQVRVTDAANNPIPNHPVTLKVAAGGGTINGTAPSDTVKQINTNSSGLVSVQWYLGCELGDNSQKLVATSTDGVNQLQGSPLSIFANSTVGDVDGDASLVTSNVSSVPADGQSVAVITVTLTDKCGNPIPGKPISILSSSSSDVISQPPDLTDENGKAVGTISSSRAGVRTIRARIIGGITLDSSTTLTFTALDPQTMVMSGGNNQTANIGTAVDNPIEVTVLDNNNNPVSGIAVDFEVTSGGGFVVSESFSQQGAMGKISAVATTNSEGKARVTWVLGLSAGPNSVRATASFNGSPLTGSPVNFNATATNATATRIILDSGNNQDGYVACKVLPQPLSVKVVDANNKAVANVEVLFTIKSGGGELSIANPKSDFRGLAQTILTLGPVAGLNAVEAANSALSGSPITFTAESVVGEAAILTQNSGNGGSGQADALYSISAKVTDVCGNPVKNAHVAFQVVAGGASIQTQENSTDDAGIAVAQLKLPTTIGTVIIKVTSNDLPGFFKLFTIDVVAAAATTIERVSGNNQEGTIGRELVFPLRVKVKDTFGNPVIDYEVSWVRTIGSGSLRDVASRTDSTGIASNVFTLGSQPGTNEARAVTALTPSQITFTATGVTNKFPLFTNLTNKTVVEGTLLSFQVTATDDDGDPITYEAQNLPSGASFSAGSRTFSWTPNNQQAGSYAVTFIARDNKGGLDSETITITVTNSNHPPVISAFNPPDSQFNFIRGGGSITFSVTATDPDNQPLTYRWEIATDANPNGTLVSTSAQYVFNTDDFNAGTFLVEVEVSDGQDKATNAWTLDLINSVELVSFSVQFLGFDGAQISWITSREIDNLGFNVLRSGSENGVYVKLNDDLIAPSDNGEYQFVDKNVVVGQRFYYKLEDVDIHGRATQHGPVFIDVTAPQTFELSQNYPNPFNPQTHIRFQLPQAGQVTIKIFDVLGKEVATLLDDRKEAGFHVVTWNAADNFGRPASSGVYYYQIVSGEFRQTKKMLLIK